MDFALTEEQTLVRDTTREFAREEIAARARELDAGNEPPAGLLARMAEMGYFGMSAPPDAGGGGLDPVAVVVALEELARGDAGLALVAGIQNAVLVPWLSRAPAGTVPASRLAELVAGEALGCVALELDATRSLDAAQPLRAAPAPGGFVLNGLHSRVVHGGRAAWVLALAGSEGDQAALFAHDLPAAGVRVRPAEEPGGLRLASIAGLDWEQARLPASAAAARAGGASREGAMLAGGLALASAAVCVGTGEAAFEAALAYAQERSQFGRRIVSFAPIQAKFARMRAELDAARLLLRHAAWLSRGGEGAGLRAALESKLHAGRVAVAATHAALQVFGGYGCMEDYPAAKLFRDARAAAGQSGGARDQSAYIVRELLGQNAV